MAVVGMLGAILASRWCMVASQELRCHGGHACGDWDPVAFRQYMDLWHCYRLAAMLLLPSTSWRPATAAAAGAFISPGDIFYFFWHIFG